MLLAMRAGQWNGEEEERRESVNGSLDKNKVVKVDEENDM